MGKGDPRRGANKSAGSAIHVITIAERFSYVMSLIGKAGLDLRSWAKSLAASKTVIIGCVIGFAFALGLRTFGTSADSDLASGLYHLISQGSIINALYGLATVGDLIWAPMVFWLYVFRKDNNESTSALLLAVAMVTAMAMTEILKTAFNLPRPFQVPALGLLPRGEVPTNPGLPSGHTTNAFTLATVMWYRYPVWRVPFVFLAVATGTSMIILGLHFPSDVIAGTFLGVFCGTFALGLGKIRNR